MARLTITASNLTSGSDTTNATSYVTASVSPAANALLLLRVLMSRAGASPPTPTVTGAGLTWVLVRRTADFTVGAATGAVAVFRALGSSPSSGALTIDFGGVTEAGVAWALDQYTNVDASGTNGSGAVVQSAIADSAGVSVTTLNTTLAALENSGNVNATAVGVAVSTGVTPDAQFAERADVTFAAPNAGLQTEDATGEATCDPSWASARAVMVSVEVKCGTSGIVAAIPSAVGDEQIVVTIEGIPFLLTTGPTDAAVSAYGATAWAGKPAYGGLFVVCQNVSKLHPYDPFVGGGTCTLYVKPEGADVFGVTTARRNAGAETQLLAAANRSDTTLTVRSTAAFAASGEAYIGNECFSYTGTTATTFTGCQRGRYAPFSRESDEFFSQTHRYGNEVFGIALEPAVTLNPRTWRGRMVAVRRHTVVAGVLEPAASAEVLFAGTIGDLTYDQQGNTVVTLISFLERMRKQTVGRRLWHAQMRDGVYLVAGDVVQFEDFNGAAPKTANALTVVSTVPASANEIAEGYYLVDEFLGAVNEWLASELTAARLYGTYTFSVSATDSGYRTSLAWRLNGVAINVSWRMHMSSRVASFLGLIDDGSVDPSTSLWDSHVVWGNDDADETWAGSREPFRSMIGHGIDPGINWQVETTEQRGSINDQRAFFPALGSSGAGGGPDIDDNWPGGPFGHSWGIFLVDNTILLGASWDPLTSGEVLEHVFVIESLGGSTFDAPPLNYFGRPYGDEGGPMEIRQVLHLEGKFRDLVKALFMSTGTTGYNVTGDDSLGHGIGAAIPYTLLGDPFALSLENLEGGDSTVLVVIDKEIKFAELLSADLMLRRAHLLFHAGQFRFASWSTPTADLAQFELTEDNKADPYSSDISQRTVTRETDEYQKPIIRIDYNRGLRDDTYRSHQSIEDLTAVDDLGSEAQAGTIIARNTYGDFPETGAGIEDLAPGFIAWHPYWSRPVMVASRSISKELYGAIKPGDIAVITDPWIRDATTGAWGVAGRPCLVMEVKWDHGGRSPDGGKPRDPVGEIVVAFLHLDRVGLYSPCAQFSGASYNSGTKTITTLPHEHSESTATTVDAARFTAGDKITIVEIDPSNPAAPLSWTRSVSSVTGNDIVHDGVALAAFDAAKTYRVISQGYSTAQSTQRTKVYQADDADGLVSNLVQPYQYGQYGSNSSFTKSLHTDLPERYAKLAYGDGAPLDTGHARGLARMVNNLYDHTCAVQSPCLDSTAAGAVVSGGGTYGMTHLVPIFLGVGTLPSFIERYVNVAPFFRSKTGASVTCRVTLSTSPPQGDSLTDVTFPSGSVSATFTTSSTSYAVAADQALSLRVVGASTGLAFLTIEGTTDCECTGLAQCNVGERIIALP